MERLAMNRSAEMLPTDVLQALDAGHHLHPFTDHKQLHAKGARIITRADGIYLTDSDGNRILDGMAGLWCVNIGYGRKEVIEAVSRQIAELPYYNTFFQTSHLPVIALSEKLAEIAPPGFNRTFFSGSGSDSNDTVLRMVRHYWSCMGQPERQVIIGRRNGYHGSTVAGASLGGMGAMHQQGGLPIPGIAHIDQPYWFGEGGDMDPNEFGLERARQLEQAIERIGADKVAAFIAEPIQGAGGVIVPPDSYWPEISRICRERGILLVVDEVICGFGRLGKWFGTQHYGLDPDLMPIAKGLTSGYLPMGGVLVHDRFAEPFMEKAGEFYHGYTYSGHPVCAAAALANLNVLDNDGLIERAGNDIGPYLQQRWASLAQHDLVGETRMVGLMGALELVPRKPSRERFPNEGEVGLLCRDLSFANGLVMRSVRDSMIISPPLVITYEEVDELVRLAGKTLDDLQIELKRRGLV